MSAFVVEFATIHAVVAALSPLATSQEGTDLGRRLLRLNERAVNDRYGANDPSFADAYTYDRAAGLMATNVARYKAVSCFLYQCTEGSYAPSRKLYHDIKRAKERIADEIIRAMPAYEAAYWG